MGEAEMATRQGSNLRQRSLDLLERGGLPLVGILLFAFFATDGTSGSVFIGNANIKNILGDQAVVGLVALAMVIPLTAGYFDFTVAGTCGVVNVAMAATIGPHGWPVLPAMLFCLAIGALIGTITGFLVAKLRLNAFVVTLGGYTLLGGLAALYTKGRFISEGIPSSFTSWGSGTWLGVPKPFYLLIAIALIAWYVLSNTPFGRYMEGIGSNERAAQLVGVNVTRTIWSSFILSGLLAAVAGILLTSRAGSGSSETASTFLFPAFTAVFLGATTIRPGNYNVWGTVVGVYFVAIAVSGFILLGAETWVQPVFNGTALIVAVAITTFAKRARERGGSVRVADIESPPHEDPLPGGDGAGRHHDNQEERRPIDATR
jgi:ribose transport system permease protein